MPSPEDIQYAIANTQVILAPRSTLSTFGETVIHYHLISEKMDRVNEVCVREGRIHAERPQVITSAFFEKLMLDGFGDEAQSYIDWLHHHFRDLAFLKYGFRFRKESYSEHITHEPLDLVVQSIKTSVEAESTPLSTVLVGVDDAWEICLLKFTTDFIRNSAPSNFSDLHGSQKLRMIDGIPLAVREDIQEDMNAVGKDSGKLKKLAEKLRYYGIFEAYEDNFYELVRQVGRN